MPNRDYEEAYGCVFCRTGHECRIAKELMRKYPMIETLVPMKLRYRRIGGMLHEESVILFPGYIFFRASEDFPAFQIAKANDVFRLLCYSRDDWYLYGSDELLAKALYDAKGTIGFSKVYYEGDRIRVCEGFLKDYESQILRVNRRRKTAQIRINIQEKSILIWVGFEEIEKDINNINTENRKY